MVAFQGSGGVVSGPWLEGNPLKHRFGTVRVDLPCLRKYGENYNLFDNSKQAICGNYVWNLLDLISSLTRSLELK